jgi:hypothetical protein
MLVIMRWRRLGNDNGVKQIKNDRSKASLAIKNDNGVDKVIGTSTWPKAINNDNGGGAKPIGISAWPKKLKPKPINNDNGGAKPIGSSSWPKPNQVNNDNGVAKFTLVWPKSKPINNVNCAAKVIGTSAWPINNDNDNVVAKGTSMCPKPKPINNDNSNGGDKPLGSRPTRFTMIMIMVTLWPSTMVVAAAEVPTGSTMIMVVPSRLRPSSLTIAAVLIFFLFLVTTAWLT